jgi:CDP-2,3-bis-(O-geranylgeranyl)-sn-glycerol synthase
VNPRSLAELFYLFLPAGAANIAPVLLTRLFGSGTPVSARWFGDHKTWRGLVGGTAFGTAVFFCQRALCGTALLRGFGAIDYASAPLVLGMAMSAGALLGDLVKSFAKRRFDIPPGASWFPWDQIDYIAGALLCSAPWVRLPASMIATTIVLFVALHLAISALGFLMGLKERLI